MPEFTLNRDHLHISKLGHTVQFIKGEKVFVPPALKAEVIAIGAVPADGDTDVLEDKPEVTQFTAEEREEELLAAFKLLKERNERGDFTGQGIPAIPALAKIVGFKPEKKEVEALWEKFRVSAE